MPQNDAKAQLQDAAAVVNQWHAAYMEVISLQQAPLKAHLYLCTCQDFCLASNLPTCTTAC